MDKKPTILMLPTWYPTKENPLNGVFFREQALAMQRNFDFVVARLFFKPEFFLFTFIKRLFRIPLAKVVFVQDDCGLKEYAVYAGKPQFIVWDLFLTRFKKIFMSGKVKNGVGIIEPFCVKKSRFNIAAYIKQKKLLPHFDCVYSLTSQGNAPFGKAFANIFGVPHITAEHAPFPWPGYALSDSEIDAIETADEFLAISNDKIRQVLLQNIKINPFWVGNLCDENKFSLSQECHAEPAFLIVAAYVFYKNYPLFIKSMEELKRIATKRFKIIIAGYNSNKGYSKNAEELESVVQHSVIAPDTEMIGSVSRNEMPILYNSCDVFVMTSIQEGLPVSAIEASMSGLPVISTRCGGVEDYVDDSMGRIFPITDYQGIAKACNDYLNGEIVFDRKHIRGKAIELFGVEAFTTRMKKVFDRAMDNYK